MSTQTQPAPVLAWHREAAKATCAHAEHWYRGPGKTLPDGTFGEQMSAIIAQHDPHAETVRLLELAKQELAEARKFIDGQISISPKDASALLACTENRIRAHLAALQQEGAAK